MHTRLFAVLPAVLAFGLSLTSPAHDAVKVDTNGDGKSEVSCSVSPRVRLLRAAGTTSIITTTFALLGVLFILRRRRF